MHLITEQLFEFRGQFIRYQQIRKKQPLDVAEDIVSEAFMLFLEKYEGKVNDIRAARSLMFLLMKKVLTNYVYQVVDDRWLADGAHGERPSRLYRLEYWRKYRLINKEKLRKNKKAWFAQNPDKKQKEKEQQARWYRNLKKDPVRFAQWRENQYRARRLRQEKKKSSFFQLPQSI